MVVLVLVAAGGTRKDGRNFSERRKRNGSNDEHAHRKLDNELVGFNLVEHRPEQGRKDDELHDTSLCGCTSDAIPCQATRGHDTSFQPRRWLYCVSQACFDGQAANASASRPTRHIITEPVEESHNTTQVTRGSTHANRVHLRLRVLWQRVAAQLHSACHTTDHGIKSGLHRVSTRQG